MIWRGVILRAIQAGGAGQCGESVRSKRASGKRIGCIRTTWARTPATACWPHCGASCSAMTISPRSTVRTMDGTACHPACCPRHGRDRVPPSLLPTAWTGPRATQPAAHGMDGTACHPACCPRHGRDRVPPSLLPTAWTGPRATQPAAHGMDGTACHPACYPRHGRDRVPPSLLPTALLLQTYDKVSDAEVQARADFDFRWQSPPSATTGGGVGD